MMEFNEFPICFFSKPIRQFLVVVFLVLPPLAHAVSPETVRRNNEGVELFKTEQYHEAYKKFTEGMAIEPFDPYLQSNLGHSFLNNEEKEKAFKSFKAAQELAKQSGDPGAIFATTLNLATMKATNGDVAGALKDFQYCLDMNPPEEQLKLVRENIEKMWQAQQGQGQGGQDDQQKKNQDQQDGKGQQDQQQKEPDQGDKSEDQKKKKPKPFDSKELTKDDVRKILEELENQEQKIRAEVYEGQGKERPRDKDW